MVSLMKRLSPLHVLHLGWTRWSIKVPSNPNLVLYPWPWLSKEQADRKHWFPGPQPLKRLGWLLRSSRKQVWWVRDQTALITGDWGTKVHPIVRDQACDHFRNLVHETMGPNEMHPRVGRELATVVAKQLCIDIPKVMTIRWISW